jgi:tellurite resistance protein
MNQNVPAATGTMTGTTHGGMLGYLPVASFGAVMGLAGLSIAWRQAHAYFSTPLWIAQFVAAIAIMSFIVLTAASAIKSVTSWDKVRDEFAHPVAGNLFATPLISLLLLPIVLAEFSLPIARDVGRRGGAHADFRLACR